jgi:hypothetical protein
MTKTEKESAASRVAGLLLAIRFCADHHPKFYCLHQREAEKQILDIVKGLEEEAMPDEDEEP